MAASTISFDGMDTELPEIKAHYNDLHLYTETPGKNILVDYLQLPYTSCHTTYDNINHYKSCLYALPKIMTYAG